MAARGRDLIALSLAILLLASHCDPQSCLPRDSLQKEGETFPLAGKVVNSVTGKPIPRVLVRLPKLQRATLTDQEGNFSFNHVSVGKVAILLSKPGYFRAGQPLVPDQSTYATIRRMSSRSDRRWPNPLQAAERIPQPKTAAAEDSYPIEVYFPGTDAIGAAPLDLAAGQEREANFNLKLIRVDKANPSSTPRAEPEQAASPKSGRFQISGVLVDDLGGGPIPQGQVTISEVTHPYDPFAAVVTGADGRFSFSGLAEGKYYLMASHRDRRGFSFYDSHDGLFTTAIVVGTGLEPGYLVFRLPTPSRLSGLITDEAGEPVHKARVLLFWTGTKYGVQNINSWYQAETNEQGAYHFDLWIPGKYFIAVMASPWYAQRPAAPQPVQTDFHSSFLHDGQTLGTYLEEQGLSPLDVAYPVTFTRAQPKPVRPVPSP
ncbi:MAG TPA: carboxypeptidase regulatory-like domain-containing protein [Candidatus Angelobacter sp.]|jgi:hypothetical protein|nr:carboxypeptidase regulatory-like domain-containing protein [Candidatus Angelobacter sp.]